MKDILLISEKTIKENSLVNDNIGCEFIVPAIRNSQNLHLQPLIGTMLYDKIKELITPVDGIIPINLEENVDYKHLLDEYITPYLIEQVQAEIVIPISFKIRNQGLVQTTSDNTNTSGLRDVQTLKQYYENNANFYGKRMSDYLLANTIKYPEYMSCRDYADMHANNGGYNTGIVLGDVRDNRYNYLYK